MPAAVLDGASAASRGDDIEAPGRYWKVHYNTKQSASTVDEFVRTYLRHVRQVTGWQALFVVGWTVRAP